MVRACGLSLPSSSSRRTAGACSARVPLGELGRWEVVVSSDVDGVKHSGTTVLEVLEDMGTPPLGSLAPGGRTPTMRDANSVMHHISSDPEP